MKDNYIEIENLTKAYQIGEESFNALSAKYERIYYEQEGKKIDEELKNFSWDY